jgi:hypothetical protein
VGTFIVTGPAGVDSSFTIISIRHGRPQSWGHTRRRPGPGPSLRSEVRPPVLPIHLGNRGRSAVACPTIHNRPSPRVRQTTRVAFSWVPRSIGSRFVAKSPAIALHGFSSVQVMLTRPPCLDRISRSVDGFRIAASQERMACGVRPFDGASSCAITAPVGFSRVPFQASHRYQDGPPTPDQSDPTRDPGVLLLDARSGDMGAS